MQRAAAVIENGSSERLIGAVKEYISGWWTDGDYARHLVALLVNPLVCQVVKDEAALEVLRLGGWSA